MPDRPNADPWHTADLDLGAYLDRVGLADLDPAAFEPDLLALGALHEAHVRTFTFDNIDVLLEQHPGVGLAAVQEKFLGRGRGGYCFEHATLFAAVLERLGYAVRRHLGRVDTGTDAIGARTHMTVAARVAGRWWLCDPGFGMSLIRPIPLSDGVEADHYGWRSRVAAAPEGWELHRLGDGGWQRLHSVDALTVHPIDPVVGHHFTSTFPGSHFRSGLMVARYLADRHVTLTHESVTIRRAGEPTQRERVGPLELGGWLDVLEVPLTDDERTRLLARCADLSVGAGR
ncbi:arylamine N-acetyltransferase [Nocardioides sp. GY 10113]|uniref:arylamine N-acetyltransferase family protein n=1 Tax=Nocardioides sp. GY 10113 TaxID=2569761 RepID=UPI0010A8A906|nr:arylamine N-acetyltransferase [Nocardioides sp. GY 10113]TIC86328.1 arylamine N-acetyltransferase [Nocardioides sp. GY 10113]